MARNAFFEICEQSPEGNEVGHEKIGEKQSRQREEKAMAETLQME